MITQILTNYRTLTTYCDGFFASVMQRYGAHMQCRSGCDVCCELRTVCAVEGFALYRHLAETNGFLEALPAHGKCPFILDGVCRAYAARPVICRTHGVVIALNGTQSVTCSMNFADMHPSDVEPTLALDSERITMNLARLNKAFCMAVGEPGLADRRLGLADIALGKAPDVFECVSSESRTPG